MKMIDFGIFTHRNVFLSEAAPRGQRVNGHEIGLKFTVGVGEDASEFGDELGGPVLEGSHEDSLWVVVVSVDVVPDDWRPPQNSGNLLYRCYTDVLGHHLRPCQDKSTLYTSESAFLPFLLVCIHAFRSDFSLH